MTEFDFILSAYRIDKFFKLQYLKILTSHFFSLPLYGCHNVICHQLKCVKYSRFSACKVENGKYVRDSTTHM